MALIDVEGGDHMNQTAAPWIAKGWNTVNVASQPPRIRGFCWQVNSGATLVKTLPVTSNNLIVGIGINWASAAFPTNAQPFFRLLTSSSANVATIATNSLGFITVLNAANSVVATGTTRILSSTWYYIELQIFVNGSSGTCELHLNGVPGEIGSTTGNFGSTNIGQVSCTNPGNNAMQYDDMYVCDTTGSSPLNTFLGDVCVETKMPAGDSSTNNAWAPSAAGSHFNKVNEVTGTYPDGDTTYVSDSTPGDRDTYTISNLAISSGTIYAVVLNLYARKDDASVRTIAPVIRQGGTNYDGTTTTALTTSYIFYRQFYSLDPTGSPWTIGTVNGDEYGIKEVL